MSVLENITFVDSPSVTARKDHYKEVSVSTEKILKSWRESLFSFEWMLPDGRIKSCEELKESEQEKRRTVEEKLEKGEAMEKPVLGIGLLENVEIGSGRAVFLTLAAHGLKDIPVHIPASNSEEFEAFLS